MLRRTRAQLGRRTVVAATVVATLVAALVGCSGQPGGAASDPATAQPTGSPSPTGVTVRTPSPTGTDTANSTSSPRVRNDLADGSYEHGVKAGSLTLTVSYTAGIPIKDWKPDGLKPIQVSLSVFDSAKPGQSIYVTRATARFSVNDVNGVLPPPEPVVDSANIVPGYLASFPYTYDQQFVVPRLDPGSIQLTIQFKYELVTLIDKKTRDYTKQTAVDTVTIPLDF